MKWWPWRRRHANGEAKQAGREADEQLRAAHARTPHIERTARAARELATRTDRFAREVERSMKLRRGGCGWSP